MLLKHIFVFMSKINRRHFFRTTALGAAVSPWMRSARGEVSTVPSAPSKVGGMFLGAQCWTFNRFSVLEAIEMNGRAGGTVLEFYPGQRFAIDSELKWDHNATEDQHNQVRAALAQWGTVPMNYGVVGVPNNEAEARKIFDFAKKLNLYGITTESAGAVQLLEKLAEEYKIRVCFHNHPKKPNDPNYKVWDPNYILEITKDRSPLLGACADTGHWIRSGLNALDCLKLLGNRVLAMHLKDRLDAKSEDQIYGKGKAGIAAMLEYVRSQNFAGNVSIEYETNWEKSLPDVSQCVGYIRAVGEGKGWN
jgi:sugar phosphate isomerase/epimerase